MSRIEVVAGNPTPEELAAVVVALTPVATGADAADDQPPGWRRAAILEGIGDRFAVSADDLAVLERSAGRF